MQPRALVVDDNRDSADTLALALEMFGLAARALYEPLQAQSVVSEFDPDMVVLDLGMPGLSGYEVARRLREAEGEPKRVLVALTGWDGPEDLHRSAAAGFDHHMVKPPDFSALREICAGLVPRTAADP